jgi:hypothetical protein
VELLLVIAVAQVEKEDNRELLLVIVVTEVEKEG